MILSHAEFLSVINKIISLLMQHTCEVQQEPVHEVVLYRKFAQVANRSLVFLVPRKQRHEDNGGAQGLRHNQDVTQTQTQTVRVSETIKKIVFVRSWLGVQRRSCYPRGRQTHA
jgi:hypothetical protein